MIKKITLLTILLLFTVTFSYGQSEWKKTTSKGKLNGIQIDKLEKGNFEVFSLNTESFKKKIANAPVRGISEAKNSNIIVELPNDAGKLEKFKIFEAPVFSPSLSAKFPNIKSYVGYAADNSGAILRMSISSKGVQTMISYVDKKTVFMQPVEDDATNYIVYNRKSRGDNKLEKFICSTIDEYQKEKSSDTKSVVSKDANDQILRKFRLAISVNGEYTAYHGGTVEGALAAVNATMTRVNAIFETDMAVTFEVQDFPGLIYTNAATDPYSTASGGGVPASWNTELQNTLTSTIGNAAYDIGHMFGASGGGGNAGCIGCVCR